MRKLWIGVALVTLFSCEKLEEKIDALYEIQEEQQEQIRQLEAENEELIISITDALALLTSLVHHNSELIVQNTADIITANQAIQSNIEAITSNYNTINENYRNLNANVDQLINDLRQEIINLQEDILMELAAEIHVLESSDSDIIALINNALGELGNDLDATNLAISQITGDIANIQATIKCSEYEEAEDYVLPDYVSHSLRNVRVYDEGCNLTGDIIFENLYTVQFGNGLFRAFQNGEWIGTYGLDENNMNIKDWPYDKCYEDLGLFYDGNIPSLGVQVQGELVDSDLEISFEFDTNGDYLGCVNTNENVKWYVNGLLQDSNEFNVGDLNGIYVITAVIGDISLQHKVEKGSGKVVKKYGKIGKPKKVVVV